MTRADSDATRAEPRVALVTGEMFPDLYEDDFPLRDALSARGAAVDAVVWDDPGADWSVYDLAVLRSPWDYTLRRDEFVAWAESVPRLANPADIVQWNTDKHYLRDLAAAGVPVTPTTFVEPDGEWRPGAAGEWVVKPAVSVGSQDTGRYAFPEQADLAIAHLRRLQEAGRSTMIQPYLAAVDEAGETSVLCTPDETGRLGFSHAIRKGPLLTGPDTPRAASDYVEDIRARTPSEAELAVTAQVLAAIPGGADRLLYARIDLLPGPDGAPLLLELELTEPSLFFRTAGDAADRLAAAVMSRINRRTD